MKELSDLQVVKRDGRKETLCTDKIMEILEWSCEGLKGVSSSTIYMNAKLRFYEGMPTTEIHDTLIRSASDLINEYQPDYQYVAGRLLMTKLRKEVYGVHEPCDFLESIQDNVALGKYDEEILEKYTEDEINLLSSHIDHELDMNFTYAAMVQWEKKYLIQNRVTGKHYESPQYALMLIAMCLFQEYPLDVRIGYVLRFYKAISNQKLSLPTPIMAGVRSPSRQFSSCTLIECGDSMDSINGVTSAINNYTAARAGIGINGGAIRAVNSPIRDGEAYHTGAIGFYKLFQAAVGSCSQGGTRKGSATLFYPWYHKDVQDLLVLKNNKGSENNRVRHMDYGVQLNGFIYKKLLKGELVNLFCPNDVPLLKKAFFENQEDFEHYYEMYSSSDIPRKTVKASDLFNELVQERSSTGRVYIQNVDNCNDNGPFISTKAPIKQSNLCVEIGLPTSPLSDADKNVGEIALCTLAAFNLGAINSFDELEDLSDIIVRALDALLDYQDYPVKSAEKNKLRRTLGVGVINYAYDLARKGFKYSDGSANGYTHELFENIQYYLLKASNSLAKEQGACEKFEDTKYSLGALPLDWYNKRVDLIAKPVYTKDWEGLREEIKKYGLRNSTLTALMPAETSAMISNATNGIEPIRGLTTIKSSKDGVFRVVAPDVQELFMNYELCWDMKSNRGYNELVAIMQKWVDQAISANAYYKPANYEGNLVPRKVILKDILDAYSLGHKTAYYHNTNDGVGDDDGGCDGGSCKI